MDLIIGYVAVFALGGWVGYKINDLVIKHTFAKMIEEAGLSDRDLNKFAEHWAPVLEEAQESDEVTLDITLEKQGDMIYAYRKDNSKFIGQGRDKDELVQVLSKDFPGVTLQVRKEDGGTLLT